jgi:hypothetical protein
MGYDNTVASREEVGFAPGSYPALVADLSLES